MDPGVVRLDVDQERAAARLRALVDRNGKPFKRHRGVYLYGRPGRGKTMLMDRFFTEADSDRKQRWHFHEFFARLHAATGRIGSIAAALDALLGDARLICFDEFHVHDIGDAMLIARLLDLLFARRIMLVVTSNYPPEGLLPNPLFHDRFVPTIARIAAHLDVVSVDGAIDYRTVGVRRGAGFSAGQYVIVSEDESHSGPCSADAQGRTGTPVDIRVGTRHILAICDDSTITIDFAVLCGTATSAADYVELAQRFRRWIIRDVPLLRELPPDWVMRFVNVIDVLYNSDRELTVLARVPLADLLDGVRGVPDMGRISSRLSELAQQESGLDFSHTESR